MAACRRASSWRKGAPSCAFRGAMQSQPSMNSVASCNCSRKPLLSGQRTFALADGEDGAGRRTGDDPTGRRRPQRMVRERPAARSSSVQACGSGLRRSSRGPDVMSTKARASALKGAVVASSTVHGHGRAPLVSDLVLRTSFQSPPSIGGRSRANGILNFSPSDRWRSAKRSPGPSASAAPQRSAPASFAIPVSSGLERGDRARPMPPPVAI